MLVFIARRRNLVGKNVAKHSSTAMSTIPTTLTNKERTELQTLRTWPATYLVMNINVSLPCLSWNTLQSILYLFNLNARKAITHERREVFILRAGYQDGGCREFGRKFITSISILYTCYALLKLTSETQCISYINNTP